jgi:hypothetical protein
MAFLSILLSSMVVGEGSSPDRPLTVNGVAHPVAHAELSLRVETETFDAASQSWVYGRNPSLVVALELRTSEDSSEALAPDLYFHLPKDPPADLNGTVLEESRHQVEAWLGSEAAALQGNRLEFLSPLASGQVTVRWTTGGEGGPSLTFEGPVPCAGLSLKVKRVTDVEGFLRQVWPALDPSTLELASESELDFGDDIAEDRQHWMELHYDFK